MITYYLIDLLCIAFLVLSATFCFSWVRLRSDLPWRGRRSVAIVVKVLAVLVGVVHALFALLKMGWLVTELMTWGI